MNSLSPLTQPDVLFAGLVVMLLSLAEPVFSHRLKRYLSARGALDGCVDHFLSPVLRCLLLCLFLALAYPALFGLRVAPPLSEVLATQTHPVSHLVGILFLISLIAPLTGNALTRPAFVLPAQALLGTGTLFAWVAGAIGITAVHPWPHPLGLASLVLLSWANHRIVGWLADLGARLLRQRYDVSATRAWLERGLEPWAQLPTILVFGMLLGYRLAP